MEKAIPCGLIVAELVTNAFKYAFPTSYRGHPCPQVKADKDVRDTNEIRVEMRKVDSAYILIVSDNGVGLPLEFDMQKPLTLGMTLVRSWAVHQLKGKIEVDRQSGTKFIITF